MKRLINRLTSCTYKNTFTLGFNIVIVYCSEILFKDLLLNFELSLYSTYELRTF